MNKDLIKAMKAYEAWRSNSPRFGSMDPWIEWEELDYREQEAWAAAIDATNNDELSVCKECGFHHLGGTCLDS